MLAVTSFSFIEMANFCLKGVNSLVVKKTEIFVHFKFYFKALGLKTVSNHLENDV